MITQKLQNLKHSFLLILLPFILSSCGPRFLKEEVEKHLSEGKAFIIIDGPYYSSKSSYGSASTVWENAKTKKEIKLGWSNSSSSSDYFEASFEIVEAGTYSLKHVSHSYKPLFSDIRYTEYFEDLENIAKFTVAPGEVVHLGRLFFDLKSNKNLFKAIKLLETRQDKIEEFLSFSYGYLIPQLQIRPIKLWYHKN